MQSLVPFSLSFNHLAFLTFSFALENSKADRPAPAADEHVACNLYTCHNVRWQKCRDCGLWRKPIRKSLDVFIPLKDWKECNN